jgi:hypothetical protein
MTGDVMSLDHLIPIEFGGNNKADNLVVACRSCNAAKAERSVRQFLAYLRNNLINGTHACGHINTCTIATRIKTARRQGKRIEERRFKGRVLHKHTQLIRSLALAPYTNIAP